MPSLLAPAKLNLALHVTGQRSDGYHELSSLVVFADIGDTLKVESADALSLELSGPFCEAMSGNPRDNLVWGVAERLKAVGKVTEGARMSLEKRLPVASGMGGGSTDAATAALLLNNLWNIRFSIEELAALLLPLGADIPMCLYRRALLVAGAGEKISPIDEFPALSLVLVNPGIRASTPEVFRIYDHRCDVGSPKIILPEGKWEIALLKGMRNDLQDAARAVVPEIGTVLETLEQSSGCLLARMSGSGATCFGVYSDYSYACSASERISRQRPAWWAQPCRSFSS